jgi:hypothetical protein
MRHIKLFENYTESDVDLIVVKITEHFPYEETKSEMLNNPDLDSDTILIDMINWYEEDTGKQIEDEMMVMNRLKEEYDFLNNN